MKKMPLLLLVGLLVFLTACGGSSGNGGGNNSTPVKLNMTTASSLVGQSAQFSANIPVNWTVKENNGGTITASGLYTAPKNVGAFHVVATSKTDTTQSATASVDVSAKFLSLEKNLAGTTQPYSVSPVLNTLKSDGQTYTSTVLNDPSTNAPFDTNAFDIAISPDGTEAVATILTEAVYEEEFTWFYDLVVATADGSSLTQITHNQTTSTDNVVWDAMPQWSPDGKTIVDTHRSTDPNSQGMQRWHVATMNPDGSNLQLIFPVAPGYGGAEFPTFSPDGTKIAAEVWQDFSESTWADGIAVMNADGTNVKQLTGFQSYDSYVDCYDYMPTFTADGTKIVYTHECWPEGGGINEELYSVNIDGSNVTKVYGSDLANVMACQPRTFTDGTVAFSSNEAAPGTDAFDMYVVKLDGTGQVRVTNNSLYDGFSVWWMNWNEATASAREYQRSTPRQMRLDHHKMLEQRRAR
jgi:Tol biopolymer transport system component